MENYLSLVALKQVFKPMGKIMSIIHDDHILFQKENITFAKLTKDCLSFLNDKNQFQPTSPNLIDDSDELLIIADRSYSFAAS